jgi:hypothetical protein
LAKSLPCCNVLGSCIGNVSCEVLDVPLCPGTLLLQSALAQSSRGLSVIMLQQVSSLPRLPAAALHSTVVLAVCEAQAGHHP